MTTTIVSLDSYRNDKPYPFCPGCGHGGVLDNLDRALTMLGREPSEVVIVSDIGCSGLSDQYFATSAFHGLHGRSITYATGIKLANPDLTVIVVMGDGGTGIGGAHLINAARRNAGITVLVLNNMNFGMTGGQHSTTTPEGAITATTPLGNLEHPLDICATVGVNGAGYVYRGTSFDRDLPDRMVEAITHPGFALLDVWDLCTAYFVPNNKVGKKGLEDTIERLGFGKGVLYDRATVEYAVAYREAASRIGAPRPTRPIPIEFSSSLDGQLSFVVAGSAGAKVRSAARILGEAAIRCGLWATQRGDYPVTVKSGHSVSEIMISRTEMPPVAITVPDVLVVASEDGLAKVGGMLAAMDPEGVVVTIPRFRDLMTAARVVVVDPSAGRERIPKSQHALVLVAAACAVTNGISVDSLRAAARGPFESENLVAIDIGASLVAG
jgi:pyruvate/2-oxoacid:ferredoxin oxidoreductase beta subunit/Pyruvate/2-oxoacid:ferredoxin oxidoreductase gamma subunit